MKKSTVFKIGAVVAVALTYVSFEPIQRNVKQALFIMENLDIGLLEGYIGSFGSASLLASFLLMVFQSVFAQLPRTILIVANANVFGVAIGFWLSWIGSLAGASICFWIARAYGRKTVEKLVSRFKLEKADVLLGSRGKQLVFMTRLIPFMPFDLVSYLSGLTSMSFRSFILATGIGQLPLIFIYTYFGETFSGSVKIIVLGILFSLSASVAIFLSKSILEEKNLKDFSKKGDEEIA